MEGERKMITYENENARLLIEEGAVNLTSIVENINPTGNIYITEKSALKIHNAYNAKKMEEIEAINIMINSKSTMAIPILKMKMI